MKKILFFALIAFLVVGCAKEEMPEITETNNENVDEKKLDYYTYWKCKRQDVEFYDLAPLWEFPFDGPATGELNEHVNGCPNLFQLLCKAQEGTYQEVFLGTVAAFCSSVDDGPTAIPDIVTVAQQDEYIAQAELMAEIFMESMPCAAGYSPRQLELEFIIEGVTCVCPTITPEGEPHDYNTFLSVYGRFNCCKKPYGPVDFPPPKD